jgi:hypothetical protein
VRLITTHSINKAVLDRLSKKERIKVRARAATYIVLIPVTRVCEWVFVSSAEYWDRCVQEATPFDVRMEVIDKGIKDHFPR